MSDDRQTLERQLELAQCARRELGEQMDHVIQILGESRREIKRLRQELQDSKANADER